VATAWLKLPIVGYRERPNVVVYEKAAIADRINAAELGLHTLDAGPEDIQMLYLKCLAMQENMGEPLDKAGLQPF
jgi:hypothetical protein